MRFLYCLVVAIALFSSCSKKDSAPAIPKGIQAKINGQLTTFNFDDTTIRMPYQGIDLLVFGGATADNDMLMIGVGRPVNLITGTYDGAGTGGNAAAVEYRVGSITYKSGSNVTVTITKLGANNAEGYFSGTVSPESGGGASKSITEGSFNVSF